MRTNGYMESIGSTLSEEDALFCEFLETNKRECFEKLFKLVKPWLFRMIYRITADQQAAEDVFQDTWVALLRNKASYNPGKGRIVNFIYTIAKNYALKWHRGRKPVDSPSAEDGIDPEERFVEHTNPHHTLEQSQLAEIIRKAVAELPDEQQQAILLYYFCELDLREIAERMDKPENTIKTWLRRGRQRLEKRLLDTYKNRQALLLLFFPLF
jgi:RNA polymerase sigma factor (sigma-70 family)